MSRQAKYFELEDRAIQLKCVSKFKKFFQLYNKRYKTLVKAQVIESETSYNIEIPERNISLNSGVWRIDETGGIYTVSDKGKEYACYHPIFPIGILKNAESGLCKTMLSFKVRGCWTQININRDVLASANKIVSLATYGIQVTSENSRNLVRYLNDMEALNEDAITDHISTNKLGWINGQFMPYSTAEIVFDNDPKLMALFKSIKEQGNREKWYNLAKKIRKDGHIEVLIYMAASLASVLVEPCGALPFIVSLWGGTGLGKTVALMLATSIWADPAEGAYMSDAKATVTAMEIRLDALNSLPMCIDDMAQIQGQEDDFSAIIYRWCAGKGRDRSNQNLGLNPMTKWSNCTLTNGERSLVSDLAQGGASNRVIDVEITERMFRDGNNTAKSLKENFGFCGREFVQVIQNMGNEAVNTRFERWNDSLKEMAERNKTEKEDKQIIPMALILTADEIAEEFLYKDGIRLNPETCLTFLKDKNEVSENRRAYDYIRDIVTAHNEKFDPDDDGYRFGCWGKWMNDNQVAIIPTELSRLLTEGGFQFKSFMSWATRNNLIESEGNRGKKKVMINGHRIRCVVIDMNYDPEDTDNGFIPLEEESDIPFN